MDNDFFGIYDESFDLDGDGELDAVEFDYMMQELFEDAEALTDEDNDDPDFDLWDDLDEEDDLDDDLWDDSDDEDDLDDPEDDLWDAFDEDDDSDDWNEDPDNFL